MNYLLFSVAIFVNPEATSKTASGNLNRFIDLVF
jgi:hypothetical protein